MYRFEQLAASGDVELVFGAVLSLVVRTFANNADMQFGSEILAAIRVYSPETTSQVGRRGSHAPP